VDAKSGSGMWVAPISDFWQERYTDRFADAVAGDVVLFGSQHGRNARIVVLDARSGAVNTELPVTPAWGFYSCATDNGMVFRYRFDRRNGGCVSGLG